MSEETVFDKILRKEIPADVVYEDELVLAFRDIAPQAPVHILIIPKKRIPTVNDVEPEDEATMGRLFTAARKIAEEEGLDKGYRLIMNVGEHGGQDVMHVHLHLLGGKKLGAKIVKD